MQDNQLDDSMTDTEQPRGGKGDTVLTGTCEGACGDQSANGTCWCDDSCDRYGDCCDDKAPICDGAQVDPGADITVPAADSVSTTEVTFEWEDVGASEYSLQIGTKLRGTIGHLYLARALYAVDLPGSTTSHTVEHLSNSLQNTDGVFYVQISSRINGTSYTSYRTFTNNIQTGPVLADITSPVNGSTLGSTTETLEWEDLGAVHSLFVKDSNGRSLYSSGRNPLPEGTTSKTITNLPSDGSEIRVDLYTQYPNWRRPVGHKRFTYTAYTN